MSTNDLIPFLCELILSDDLGNMEFAKKIWENNSINPKGTNYNKLIPKVEDLLAKKIFADDEKVKLIEQFLNIIDP